jgi:hypothetical protein
MHARTRNGGWRRAGADAGFALPAVLFLVLAGLAIAAAAVTAALGSQTGVSRDYDVKDALGVAEAGIERTLERYNLSTSLADPCAASCSETLSNGSQYTSWVQRTPHNCASNPPLPHNTINVVSQGAADGVTRRIYTSAKSATSSCPFLEAGVIGLNSIQLDSNATITADVATNGNIVMDDNSNLEGCAQVGEGYAVTGAGVDGWTCSTGPVYGTTSLPPVNQGDVVTNNQNSTLLSHISGKKTDACFSGYLANGTASTVCGQPGSRELVLTNNVTLTLTSGNYSLCRLDLISTASLQIAAGAIVRIYFDDPNDCGYAAGDPRNEQLKLSSNSKITVTGGNPGHVALLFVGSETIPTWLNLKSNTVSKTSCSQDFVVYGPRTDILINSNAWYCGAIAGKTIDVDSEAEITISNEASSFDVNAADDHYYPEEFKECAGAAAAYTTPFASC